MEPLDLNLQKNELQNNQMLESLDYILTVSNYLTNQMAYKIHKDKNIDKDALSECMLFKPISLKPPKLQKKPQIKVQRSVSPDSFISLNSLDSQIQDNQTNEVFLFSKKELLTKTVIQLRKLCKQHKVKQSGNKQNLIERLCQIKG